MADKRRNLGIPAGVVFPFAGNEAPYGYLMCDGRAISRTEYPTLFAALGTSHGHGDGLTTFNLPDYRGQFLRGVDGSANQDPDKAGRAAMKPGGNTGNNVGSIQGHQLQSHAHQSRYSAYRHGVDPGGSYWTGDSWAWTTSVGGNETRPKNVYVNYIIKV